VDIATHALASYALARGIFPRRRWPVYLSMVCAGTVADVDLLSVLGGPAAYFVARRTFTHSLLGSVVVAVLCVFFARYLDKKQPEPIAELVLPCVVAAVFHVLFDLLQSEGVQLLWPFHPKRFAADWLPTIDPWILALLMGGIFVPELLRLITSEIGVKDKSPRGRRGALVALTVILMYVGARAILYLARGCRDAVVAL
jgi:membrane-bound metal-dependent hydrolase YbcI (DUF457 family)